MTSRIVEAYARMLGNAGRFDEAAKVIAGYRDQGLATRPCSALEARYRRRQAAGHARADRPERRGRNVPFHRRRPGRATAPPTSPRVFLRLALYLDPDVDLAAMQLGQLYEATASIEAANAIYDSPCPILAHEAEAVVRVAENLDAVGDRDEAIKRLRNDRRTPIPTISTPSRCSATCCAPTSTTTRRPTPTPRRSASSAASSPSDWRFYYVRGICL